MATAPKMDPAQIDAVLQIAIADIEVGERIGLFWPDKAAALGKLIAADGQRTPITVKRNGPKAAKPYSLVVGQHRLEGCRMEGIPAIDAIIVTGQPHELLDMQVSENLERRDLTPLERAAFIRAKADAAEERVKDQHDGLTQQQVAIRARWAEAKAKAPGVVRPDDLDNAEADYTAEIFSGVYGWQESVAEAIGMTSRSVRLALALHRALIAPFPRLWRDLAAHPVIGSNASALREIASIGDEDMRGDLIASLIANPDMKLDEAMEGLGLSKPAAPAATGATKFMNNALSNLSRLSLGDQRQIAADVVKTFKPQALLALRAALDARIEAEGIGE